MFTGATQVADIMFRKSCIFTETEPTLL